MLFLNELCTLNTFRLYNNSAGAADKMLTHFSSVVLRRSSSKSSQKRSVGSLSKEVKEQLAMSNGSFPVLNPNTPLAFLYASEATQLEIYRYCSVATLGVSLLLFLVSKQTILCRTKYFQAFT